MAASSIQDLMNFETHFESAAVTFVAAGISSGFQVIGTMTETDLLPPRVELKLELGEASLPVTRRNGGASPNTDEFIEYSAFWNVRVITDNAVGQTSDHATARAKIRELFLVSGTNWNSSTLPYYDLKFIQPMECNYLTDEDFNVTELAWNLKFEIRRDAWPS